MAVVRARDAGFPVVAEIGQAAVCIAERVNDADIREGMVIRGFRFEGRVCPHDAHIQPAQRALRRIGPKIPYDDLGQIRSPVRRWARKYNALGASAQECIGDNAHGFYTVVDVLPDHNHIRLRFANRLHGDAV